MRTQQAFYKNKTPQNIRVVNSNFNNIYKNNYYNYNNYNNYNNYISMNKFNTLYNINYNNNRKNNNELTKYSSKKLNTENEGRYYLKSQNYFSKDYKSINNIRRNNRDRDFSISTNKSPNRTNINFYLSKNHINNFNKSNDNKNTKNNLSTLPSIKTGYQARNKSQNNNNYDNNIFNKNNNINNNINIDSNSNTKLNNIKTFHSIKNNKSKNNNRYYKATNYSSPTKYNIFQFNPNNNENNINETPSLNFLLREKFLLYKNAKYSEKSFNLITGYGVNTYKGIIRNYNEDRISVIVNAKYNNQKLNNNNPKVSFFAIYDGHAGNKCCEFLKNNLHNYILESNFFPDDPIKAIEQGFNICEKKFIESIQIKNKNTNINKFRNKNNNFSDYSGSCAIIILIINDICYTINLGDSRALYSYDKGTKFYQLSRDHKPNDNIEKERIYKAGGSIFKTNIDQYGLGIKESELGFKIPFRILPGRLAVSKYIFIFNYRFQELLEILMLNFLH